MVLEEFLRTHAENEIRDPIKRVLLERDLWAVFDWSASSTDDRLSQSRELQVRLAEVMRRLALTTDEIKSLPETYSQALASGVTWDFVRGLKIRLRSSSMRRMRLRIGTKL
jgi:hypothetical protein